MHYGMGPIQRTVYLLLGDERILYRWCENMSSRSPKPESFDVCQHRQNQSRSPKTIRRQQSQRGAPPPPIPPPPPPPPSLSPSEPAIIWCWINFCSSWWAMKGEEEKKKCLVSKIMKHSMTRPYQPNEKNRIIFKRGFKCLPARLLATSSCAGNINWETVIRPSA